jgi:hypothetical protein
MDNRDNITLLILQTSLRDGAVGANAEAEAWSVALVPPRALVLSTYRKVHNH